MMRRKQVLTFCIRNFSRCLSFGTRRRVACLLSTKASRGKKCSENFDSISGSIKHKSVISTMKWSPSAKQCFIEVFMMHRETLLQWILSPATASCFCLCRFSKRHDKMWNGSVWSKMKSMIKTNGKIFWWKPDYKFFWICCAMSVYCNKIIVTLQNAFYIKKNC